MTTQDAKVDDEMLQQVERWFQNTGVKLICPMCGHNRFSSFDYLVTPVKMTGAGMTIGGETYPLFSIVCANCTNVQQFSAVAMGLLPQESDTTGPGDDKTDS